MPKEYPLLYTHKFSKIKNNLPEFNEVESGTEINDDFRKQYNKERITLLKSWHNGEKATGVKIKDFSYTNGLYEGSGIVYRPNNDDRTLPLVFFVHGGGWSTLSKECYHYECVDISKKASCVVISIDYRLAPEHKFPTGLEDSYCALEAAVIQSKTFRADSSKIAVIGDSAGGNICAALCHMARDRKGPNINLQILCYPATGVLKRKEIILGYLKSDEDYEQAYLSPILGNLKGLPYCQIIVGTCDFLFEDNIRYARALMDAGVEVDLQVYEGIPHGFIQMVNEYGKDAIDTICEKLKMKLW